MRSGTPRGRRLPRMTGTDSRDAVCQSFCAPSALTQRSAKIRHRCGARSTAAWTLSTRPGLSSRCAMKNGIMLEAVVPLRMIEVCRPNELVSYRGDNAKKPLHASHGASMPEAYANLVNGVRDPHSLTGSDTTPRADVADNTQHLVSKWPSVHLISSDFR